MEKSFMLVFICNLLLLSSASSFSLRGIVNFISDKISNQYCSYVECCTEIHVPMDVTGEKRSPIAGRRELIFCRNLFPALRYAASRDLFGQPLVEEAFHAFSDYWRNGARGSKPLAVSFHGWPGVGKTHFSRMIVRAFYKNGPISNFVKIYNGLSSFPNPDLIYVYKVA